MQTGCTFLTQLLIFARIFTKQTLQKMYGSWSSPLERKVSNPESGWLSHDEVFGLTKPQASCTSCGENGKYTSYTRSSHMWGAALKYCTQVPEQGCGRRTGWREELKSLRLHQRWIFTGPGPGRLELRAWIKERDKDVAKYFFFLFSFSELFIDVILQLQSINPTQAQVIIAAGGSGWFCNLSALLQMLKTRREGEQM